MSEITLKEIHSMEKEQCYLRGYDDGKQDGYQIGYADGYDRAEKNFEQRRCDRCQNQK